MLAVYGSGGPGFTTIAPKLEKWMEYTNIYLLNKKKTLDGGGSDFIPVGPPLSEEMMITVLFSIPARLRLSVILPIASSAVTHKYKRKREMILGTLCEK